LIDLKIYNNNQLNNNLSIINDESILKEQWN